MGVDDISADFDGLFTKIKEKLKGRNKFVIIKDWGWKDKIKPIEASVNADGKIIDFYGVPDFAGEQAKITDRVMGDIGTFINMLPFSCKRGDILQYTGNIAEGVIVDYVNEDGRVYGYEYYDSGSEFAPYGTEVMRCFMYERCGGEKAEKVRIAFKEATAKMQDIVREWE